MTTKEIQVLELLGEAYNKFCELLVIHPRDHAEFTLAIHAAQNIVLARAGLRELNPDRIPLPFQKQ